MFRHKGTILREHKVPVLKPTANEQSAAGPLLMWIM